MRMRAAAYVSLEIATIQPPPPLHLFKPIVKTYIKLRLDKVYLMYLRSEKVLHFNNV